MTSDRAQWRGAELLVRSAQRRLRSCQVLDFTLDLAYSVLKESDIDRGLRAFSEQLTGVFGTLLAVG